MGGAPNESPSITCQPTRMSHRAASERRGKRGHPSVVPTQEACVGQLRDLPRHQGGRAPHRFLQMFVSKHSDLQKICKNSTF